MIRCRLTRLELVSGEISQTDEVPRKHMIFLNMLADMQKILKDLNNERF